MTRTTPRRIYSSTFTAADGLNAVHTERLFLWEPHRPPVGRAAPDSPPAGAASGGGPREQVWTHIVGKSPPSGQTTANHGSRMA